MGKNNKRILVLNYEFPPIGGGASPVSYEITKGYVDSGSKVDVVTMSYKNLPSYEKIDGINIYRVKSLRSKKEICSPIEQLSYIISARKFLSEHLKKERYDIVHCHFIIPTGVLAKWVKKNFNIPYFITSHGSDVLGYNTKRGFRYIYPLIKNEWRKIVKEAKIVVAPSEFLQEKIVQHTEEAILKVIPNGIEKGKFVSLEKQNRIIVVARLFENKGVQDLIKAIGNKTTRELLIAKNWKVDIVGEGPYRHNLEALVNNLEVSDLIQFHGWVDNSSDEMKKLYGQAKVFISPSWFESFGLTALEALSAGCYPILSNIPGYRQFDLPEENYFELTNSEQLSRLIEKFIKREKSVPVNIERFYWENVLNKYNEIING